MSVNYLMSQPSFRADPRKEMTDFMAAMDAMSFDDMDAWLLRPFGQFREVMAEAASSR
jgi:hypothetical protein